MIRRYIRHFLVFFATFGFGLLCVSNDQPKRVCHRPLQIEPIVETGYDFSARVPDDASNRHAPIERKTYCTDRRIMPIWNTLLGDKASREVLEYSTDVTDCKDILEIKYFDLNGDRKYEVLVRAVSIPSCGAVGNCDFWILEKRNGRFRIILHDNDYWDITEMGKQVLRERTNEYRDILLKGHFSAAETSFVTYRYNGKRYVQARCRYQVPDHSRSDANQTKWHFIPCIEFARRLDN
jgi:hypothetical protein